MASDATRSGRTAAENYKFHADAEKFEYQATSSNFPAFIINKPQSEHADKIGLSDGELISSNADLAAVLAPKQTALQERVRDLGLTIGMTYFKNWGDTQQILLLYAKPTEVDQVQALVTAANDLDIKMGMGGAYHTWSPTYPDAGGLLINTCDLKLQTSDDNRRIYFDEANMTVTISPGVTTGELMKFFLNHNICFESDVILPTVTYGGVLSGGCHGTGKDQQSMCDWIVSMKVVDGTGSIRQLPELGPGGSGVTSDQILKAAQVCLGLFGVVIEYTLKVQPMSNCIVKNIFDESLQDVVSPPPLFGHGVPTEKLAALLKEYWSVEIFWFPFNSLLDWVGKILPTSRASQINIAAFPEPPAADTKAREMAGLSPANILTWLWSPWNDKLWIRGIKIDRSRKTEVSLEPGVPLWSKVMDVAMGTVGKNILVPLIANVPGVTPFTLLSAFSELKLQYGTLQGDEVVRTPWAVHYRDAIDLMPCYDLEFAFPIDITDPKVLVEAIWAVVKITADYARCGKYPSESSSNEKINFPLTLAMEMRVLKHSDTLLCPASITEAGKDHVAYIEVLSTSGTPGYEQYFTEVAQAWMKLGGTPHWHKQWTFLKKTCNIFDYVRSKYGQNITTFMDVRQQLNLDPKNLFMNETMAQVFHP